MNTNTADDHPGFEVFLLLGSNMGQRESNIMNAYDRIRSELGEELLSSKIYESAAWGKEDQQDFLNQVIKINTQFGPWELLQEIQKIEKEIGRERHEKWAERIIDIDILYFSDAILNAFDLEVPHPGIPNRKFTLVPLTEIAPEFLHPKLELSQLELLNKSDDKLWVREFKK